MNIKNPKQLIEYISSLSEEELNDYKINQEKKWRNEELTSTDWIVQTPDHPKREAYLTYRQELRDYPSQADFPNGERPIKP